MANFQPMMRTMSDLKQLTKLVLDTLDDNKAIDVVELDVSDMTEVIDTMVICSATSSRHAKTLADKLVQATKDHDFRPLSIQGTDDGEWVLIDLLDIVVHIMLPEAREFYSLEKLWSTAIDHRQQSSHS
jgi:ribosome-associated protein